MKKTKLFLINITTLTLSGFILKLAGIYFTVYITGKIGADMYGLFSLILSIFSLASTFAFSGLGLATTRLVSEELAIGNKSGSIKAFRTCCASALVCGLLSGISLFLISDFAAMLVKEPSVSVPLKCLSFGIPFCALCNIFGGYFTAVRRVHKGITAMILEQLLRIALSVVLLKEQQSEESAMICLCISGTLSEILSVSFQYILYRFDIAMHFGKIAKNKEKRSIFKRLLSISLPVALSSYLRGGLSTLRNIIIPTCLISFGYTRSVALSKYAYIVEMALPIIMFASSVLYSFANLVVPELASLKIQGKNSKISFIVKIVIKFSCFFAFFVSAILFIFADDFGKAVYNNIEVGRYIRMLSPLIIFIYIDSAVDGMLKGLNEQTASMVFNLFEAGISLLLVIYLLPEKGINGYIAILYICEIFNTTLSVSRLMRVSNVNINFLKTLILPGIFAFCACVPAGFLSDNILPESSTASLTATIFASAVIYYLFLKISRLITSSDSRLIKSIFH